MKINMENWQEFSIGYLFKLVNGIKYPAEYRQKGTVPLVSTSAQNNGISDYIADRPEKYSNILTVAYSGSVGATFYHEKEVFIGETVFGLIPKFKITRNIGNFLATILNYYNYIYSYGRKIIGTRYVNDLIRLPAKNNEPDWKYMESYITNLSLKLPQTKIKKTELSLNTRWKEFGYMEIFKLEGCKCSNASTLTEGYDVFYIGAKKSENGVMKKVYRNEQLISKGNCIIFICDGQGSVGYSNYLDVDFIGSTTLSVGYNENLNKYNAQFLITILDLERFKYSFGRKRKGNLISSTIRLPVNDTGKPDWQYMENYIKSLPYADLI